MNSKGRGYKGARNAATTCSPELGLEYADEALQNVVAPTHPYKGCGGYISAAGGYYKGSLPAGLRYSACPRCGGRAVVVAPAADGVLCAGCAPLRQVRRREPEREVAQ